MRRPIIALGLVLGLLAPLGASPATADTGEGRITFYRSAGEAWVSDVDGAGRERLAPVARQYPRLSPDGTTVSYWSNVDGIARIWRADVASGDLTRVALASGGQTRYDGAPWSPDGSQLAYAAHPGEGSSYQDMAKRFNDVYIVSRTGVRIRKIDVCTGMTLPEVLWLDWSGDGKLWAVCRSNSLNPTALGPAGFDRQVRVYRMNPNGSGQALFHALPAGHEAVWGLAVSKDGKKALISSEHATTSARRTVVRTTAGTVTRIDALFGAMSWSPDGKRLAGWTSGAGLWTIKADGTGKTPIPGTQVGDANPHWSRVETCGAGFEPSNGGELIIGTPDDDVLEGTPGNDVICGLSGSDDLYGFDGEDFLDGGAGNDRVYAGDGDDVLLGGGGRDHLDGGDGFDTMDGGPGNDTLRGLKGPDHLFGGFGDDELRGGPGDDLLSGQDGKDLLIGDAGDDRLSGGADADTLVGDDLPGDVTGADVLEGGPGADTLLAGRGDDELHGEGGDDSLFGEKGDDLLLGGDGDDILRGGADRDRLAGGAGSDTLKGGPDNDHLTGGPRKDRLEGEGGSDTLIARDGIRDIVRGGPGPDKARIDPGTDDVTGVETLLP